MASSLAILLRNSYHSDAGAGVIRYALKCQDISIQIAKTPIQIPVTGDDPALIDIGFYRPSITLTGLVDDIGQNTGNTTAGYEGMEIISHTGRDNPPGGTAYVSNYFVPYKNKLEAAVYEWIATDDNELELEIINAQRPYFSGGAHSTGGGIYQVAIQQARFQKVAAREDRWEFTMQFVCKARKDVF